MQKLSEQEMGSLLQLIGKASSEQLRRASETIHNVHDLRHRQATGSVRIGSKVKWNGKHGPKAGTVVKVKQKYVEVKEDGQAFGLWNVPAGLLEVVP